LAKSPLAVAILGCGRIADAHAELIRGLESSRLVAVCDLEPLMAKQLAVRFGVPNFYSDFSELLRIEKPDVIHITTPPDSHLALSLQAIAAGCHLFVEKPVALDYEQIRTIVGAAAQNGRKLTVGYINQFDPAAVEMRHLIADGAIGRPIHLESFYGYNLAGPFGTAIIREPDHWVRRLPGQLMQNVIDHLVNKVAEFIPDDEPLIEAFGYWNSEARLHDDLRAMIIGKEVSAYATFSSRIRPDAQMLRVYGTKNSLTVDYTARTVVLNSHPTFPSVLGRLVPPFSQAWRQFRSGTRNVRRFARSEFHYFQGMRTLLSSFYDSILLDKEPPLPYPELLRTAKIMDRIFGQVIGKQA